MHRIWYQSGLEEFDRAINNIGISQNRGYWGVYILCMIGYIHRWYNRCIYHNWCIYHNLLTEDIDGDILECNWDIMGCTTNEIWYLVVYETGGYPKWPVFFVGQSDDQPSDLEVTDGVDHYQSQPLYITMIWYDMLLCAAILILLLILI